MNNVIILVGRLARNIELKKTSNGISTCNITLAVTRNYKNSEGNYETDFITCICYRHTAEMVAEYCKKGDLIGAKGVIQTRVYEKDDKKVYTTEIIVEKINFLSTAKKEEKEEIKENNSNELYEEFGKETQFELPF